MGQMELVQEPVASDSFVLGHPSGLDREPRRVEGIRHFLYLPTSQAADAVAQVLEREGWDTAVREDDDVWLVAARCLRVLTAPLVREIRAHLASVAAAHGGAYDGWEAERDAAG